MPGIVTTAMPRGSVIGHLFAQHQRDTAEDDDDQEQRHNDEACADQWDFSGVYSHVSRPVLCGGWSEPNVDRLVIGSEYPVPHVLPLNDPSGHRRSTPGTKRCAQCVAPAGRVVFSGESAAFLARPDLLGPEHARDAGTLLRAEIRGTAAHGLSALDCEGQPLFVPRLDQAPGGRVHLHVRARDVMLARSRPEDISALNVLAGRVAAIAQDGDQAVEVTLAISNQRLAARITRYSAERLALAEGEPLYAVIKSLALAEQAWERLGGL